MELVIFAVPRQFRIEYPGTINQVMNRGDHAGTHRETAGKNPKEVGQGIKCIDLLFLRY